MSRPYLTPEELNAIPIDGLTREQVREAIETKCEAECAKKRIAEAKARATEILKEAGLEVGESLRLVE